MTGENEGTRSLRSLGDYRSLTQARIALGASGSGVPTKAALQFALDHARAREAVWTEMDAGAIRQELQELALQAVETRSRAENRADYLRRPDLGRMLHPDSIDALVQANGGSDLAIVIGDGLSATAVTLNAVPMASRLCAMATRAGWSVGPVIIAKQARVALGDCIGSHVEARCIVMLIGERPGLSAADSLGCYITFAPEPGLPDSRRNCISNIRQEGLSIDESVEQVEALLRMMFAQATSGVALRRNHVAVSGMATELASLTEQS